MDFLDNLENSLKNLESQEERDPSALERRELLRQQKAAASPWAEKLKGSAYTKQLFEKAAMAGHQMRAKIYMAWLDTDLRLEVKGRWCELRPSVDGIISELVRTDGRIETFPVDLESNPDELLQRWLGDAYTPIS